jgi:hypothetical protein
MPSDGDHEGLPPELLARLAEEDAKADRETERVLAMSDEDVMKELEAEGMTRAEVEADAAAMAERIPALAAKLVADEQAKEPAPKRSTPPALVRARSTPPAKAKRESLAPAPPSHRARVLELYSSWFAVAAAGVAIVGAWGARAWSLAHHPPDANVTDGGEELTHDQSVARGLRAEALAACAARRWTACKANLDDARALDPAGEDRDPAIGELRAKVVAMLKAAGDEAAPDKGGAGTREEDTDDKKGPGRPAPR